MTAQDAELDIRELWELVREHRVFVVITTTVTTVFALAIALLSTPIYRADVTLWPSEYNEAPMGLGGIAAQFGGLADLAGLNVGLGAKTAVAVATLKSRALTETFIDQQHLMPVLFEDDWDAERKAWKEGWFKSTGPDAVHTLWNAYRIFDKEIRVISEERKTGLVTLSIEWEDAEVAARWANELVKLTNERLQRDAIVEGQKTINYLQDQLAKASSVEVQQSLNRLIEAETKKIAVAYSREQYAFKVIDPAEPPKKKVKPRRTLIVLGGLLAGLMISVALVILRAKWSSGAARNGEL